MLKIIPAETEVHQASAQKIFLEYAQESNLILSREFNLSFDINEILAQYMMQISQFTSPTGCLLLAEYETKTVGCAGLRKIDEGIGEVKRIYVQPEFRQKGIGTCLLKAIIHEAQRIGYSRLRLDTAPFSSAALALYYSLGFQNIEPYIEKIEIPLEYRQNWIFMELILPS
ncbi:GNAT family N-acetyltransferase [Nostoc sp. TCL26-01]|nr:GNAT family N-acetyltransferase [Nostoc sp. TCL26-01]